MKNRTRPVGLIVVADEPALFFSSVASAEGYLEATDVEDGVYPCAYGPSGEIYKLYSHEGKVAIELDRSAPPKPEELRELLVEVLLSRRDEVSYDAPLADLLERCESYVDDW